MIEKNIIIILLLVVITCIYFRDNIENFQTLGHYSFGKVSSFDDTIYEESIKSNFTNKKLICSLLPTSLEENCLADSITPYQANLFPVHIIQVDIKLYLAVFNNGYIYTKTNLIKDKFWKGPLLNSLPNDNIPLRMITLDANKKLLGVGYDNNLYRKKKPFDKDDNSLWELIPNTSDIIYVLYESGEKSNTDSISENDNLLAVNTVGIIGKIKYDELGSTELTVLANDTFPVLKIYYDKNGYLLGLGNDFRLYRKSSLNYEESTFNPSNNTETQVLDIIYDIDAKMYGLVFLEKIAKVELMKQNMVYFASKFLPLELSEYAITKEHKLNINNIIKFKTGVNFDRNLKTDEYGYNTIEEVKSRLELENIKDMRTMCANRGYFGTMPYHNFEVINSLQKQKEKINELNATIKNLINYDPEARKIQESILLQG